MDLVRRFRLTNVDRKFQVVHLLALMHFSIIIDIVQRYLVSKNIPSIVCACHILIFAQTLTASVRRLNSSLTGNHDSLSWSKKKVTFVNSSFRFYYIKVCGVY